MKYSLKTERTAHYHVQMPNETPKLIVVVIHGYAQLAEDFLKTFSDLQNSKTIFVAPEALSKFYNKERLPVASWMTSHEREDEIKDYINYLNNLIRTIKDQYSDLPVAVLGFSQGVSTTMRWIINCLVKIEQVFLCCGTIPPDISKDKIAFNHDVLIHYYYGTKDRLLKPEKAQEQIQVLKELNFTSESKAFEGTHEIDSSIINDLQSFSESF